MKALVIKTDGTTSTLELPDTDQLKPLQKAVGGDIEMVGLPNIGLNFYIHGEGKFERLPYNRVATAMLVANVSNDNPDYVVVLNDFLVGDVVVVSSKITDEGNDVGLTDEQIAELILKNNALYPSLSSIPQVRS